MGLSMEKNGDSKEDWRITLRLPKRDYYFIQKLVEDGEYVNAADVIRDAVKHFKAELELRAPIPNKGVKALWISKEEFEQKDFGDWFAAHTSFMLPIHRYAGEVHIFEDALVFHGKNTKTDQTEVVAIPFHKIKSVYVGFDDTYRRRETRGGFEHEAPLRIEYNDSNTIKTLYVFVDFNRITRSNKNHEWFKTLQKLQQVDG
jgi:Arc/MetJ-type ribon-helix-helix transcriptional regulator